MPKNLYTPNIFGEVRITVTGSRSIQDKSFVFECLNDFLLFFDISVNDVVLNSGKASGVDTLAEDWARSLGIHVEPYPADWRKYGKAAGMIRNKVMIDNCEYVCGIWDGKSKGTKGCLDYAKEKGKQLKVYKYKP